MPPNEAIGYQSSFRKAVPVRGEGCIRVTHPSAARQQVLLLLLPLDLHVLGLPLAFILSQDQTLRCINSFFIIRGVCFMCSSRSFFVRQVLLGLAQTPCASCSFFSMSVCEFVPQISRCKVKKICVKLPNFLTSFFYYFFERVNLVYAA